MVANPTLVFSSGGDWFQLLVKVTTLSRVDHVAIGLGDHILHARERGVVLEPRSEWFIAKRNRVIAEYEIVPDVSRGLLRCLDGIGQPYDRPGVLRTALGLALRRSFSPLKSWPARWSTGQTCAGFVMGLDPRGEIIPEWQGLPRRSATPVDLFERLGDSFKPKMQPFVQL